jgi:glucose-1-phosphate cytidylyltransferase
MVEIGGKPILWHIMNIYASHGFKEFVVACGYKSEMIKDYFHNFFVHNSDYIVDLSDGSVDVLNSARMDWRVGLVDTGIETMTAGRLLRLQKLIGKQRFMVAYGDSVGNVDVGALLQYHLAHGKTATVTAVRPPARFGALSMSGDRVVEFAEKPQIGEGWINGGFFVFEPAVFDYIKDDHTILEQQPLEKLAKEGQLMAFRHGGFWQPMDTLREKEALESLWSSGLAPWKTWE